MTHIGLAITQVQPPVIARPRFLFICSDYADHPLCNHAEAVNGLYISGAGYRDLDRRRAQHGAQLALPSRHAPGIVTKPSLLAASDNRSSSVTSSSEFGSPWDPNSAAAS